jgi:hypothetical protein
VVVVVVVVVVLVLVVVLVEGNPKVCLRVMVYKIWDYSNRVSVGTGDNNRWPYGP